MKIKLYRVILNVLFYIFYVLLASIAFSFVYPAISNLLQFQVVDVNNRDFYITIQIVIAIIIFVFSLVFRKYFYLPIVDKLEISKSKTKNETNKKEKEEIK